MRNGIAVGSSYHRQQNLPQPLPQNTPAVQRRLVFDVEPLATEIVKKPDQLLTPRCKIFVLGIPKQAVQGIKGWLDQALHKRNTACAQTEAGLHRSLDGCADTSTYAGTNARAQHFAGFGAGVGGKTFKAVAVLGADSPQVRSLQEKPMLLVVSLASG